MDENLNIDYHIKRLILKAMQKYVRIKNIAEALQIHPHKLLEYRRKYNLPIDRKPWLNKHKDE